MRKALRQAVGVGLIVAAVAFAHKGQAVELQGEVIKLTPQEAAVCASVGCYVIPAPILLQEFERQKQMAYDLGEAQGAQTAKAKADQECKVSWKFRS